MNAATSNPEHLENPAEAGFVPDPASPEVPPAPQAAPAGAPSESGYENAAAAPPLPKSPRVAAFFALLPGLGHVYNGLYRRGVAFFAVIALTIAMAAETGSPVFGLAIPFLFFFNILDSYRQANLINLGFATDLGLLDQPQRMRPGQGSLIAGVVLILIGLLEFLERVGLWQWQWLADYWPVPVMLVGAWLIFASLRDRAKAKANAADYEGGYGSNPYAEGSG